MRGDCGEDEVVRDDLGGAESDAEDEEGQQHSHHGVFGGEGDDAHADRVERERAGHDDARFEAGDERHCQIAGRNRGDEPRDEHKGGVDR